MSKREMSSRKFSLALQRMLKKRLTFLLREIALEGRDGCTLPKAFELLDTSLERRRKLREDGESNERDEDDTDEPELPDHAQLLATRRKKKISTTRRRKRREKLRN